MPTFNSSAVEERDWEKHCRIVAQLLPLYIFSFQWGMANLAALGANLYPSTVPESVLAIFIHGIGFYCTCYIMGQVYSIIINLDVASNHFISLTQDTNNWFKLRRFPLAMQRQIRRYLIHNFVRRSRKYMTPT